MLKGYDDPM
jgi:hypothetical protein